MKKGDLLWSAVLLAVILFLGYPDTRAIFVSMTKGYPFIMGFTKFFILASMGELLAIRIVTGDYKKPVGFIWRAIIWGFFGVTFVVVFPLFRGGVMFCAKQGFLPAIIWQTTEKGLLSPGMALFGKIATAFITSCFINLIFAPTFMGLHRITDTTIDMMGGKIGNLGTVKMAEVLAKIDWKGFVGFVVYKTIPFFWIPAHTITFSLPPEYQILMAAFLGIALGGILAFAKRKAISAK
jgi:hypothetical protein